MDWILLIMVVLTGAGFFSAGFFLGRVTERNETVIARIKAELPKCTNKRTAAILVLDKSLNKTDINDLQPS